MIRSRRTKPRPGRLTPAETTALRRACFERDGYCCVKCGAGVLWEGFYMVQGHMAHIISRGRGGKDELSNVQTKCHRCHLVLEHNPKPVPAKEVAA